MNTAGVYLGGACATTGAVFLGVAVRDAYIGGGLLALTVFGLLALGASWYAFGCANAGLLVADNMVVIRNPTKKRKIPISEMRRFVAGQQPSGYGNPTPGVMVELQDGRAYPGSEARAIRPTAVSRHLRGSHVGSLVLIAASGPMNS